MRKLIEGFIGFNNGVIDDIEWYEMYAHEARCKQFDCRYLAQFSSFGYKNEYLGSVIERLQRKKIMPIAREWQARPLEEIYPVVFLDAIHYNEAEERSAKGLLCSYWHQFRGQKERP